MGREQEAVEVGQLYRLASPIGDAGTLRFRVARLYRDRVQLAFWSPLVPNTRGVMTTSYSDFEAGYLALSPESNPEGQ